LVHEGAAVKPDQEKHLVYYQLLDYFQARHCPVCSAEADSCRRYFAAVLGEAWQDPEIRRELIRSQGYCQRHAQFLMAAGHPLERALLYQDQVKLFLKSLAEVPGRKAPVPLPTRRAKPRAVCPACQAEKNAGRRYGEEILARLNDQQFLAAYQGSAGLCVPHFWEALQTADDEKRRALIGVQRRKMIELNAELEEFCRKHDYRFKHEGFGQKGDVWKRAIEMMSGILDMNENQGERLTKPEKTITGVFRAGGMRRIHGAPKKRKGGAANRGNPGGPRRRR